MSIQEVLALIDAKIKSARKAADFWLAEYTNNITPKTHKELYSSLECSQHLLDVLVTLKSEIEDEIGTELDEQARADEVDGADFDDSTDEPDFDPSLYMDEYTA